MYQKQSPITSPQSYHSSSLHKLGHTVGYQSYHECIWLSDHPEVDPSIFPTRGQCATITGAQSQAIHTGAVGYKLTCRETYRRAFQVMHTTCATTKYVFGGFANLHNFQLLFPLALILTFTKFASSNDGRKTFKIYRLN